MKVTPWRDLEKDDTVEISDRAYKKEEKATWYAGVVIKVRAGNSRSTENRIFPGSCLGPFQVLF